MSSTKIVMLSFCFPYSNEPHTVALFLVTWHFTIQAEVARYIYLFGEDSDLFWI